nr:unnamed protein product [Callosobruchus chinensis]
MIIIIFRTSTNKAHTFWGSYKL